MPLDAMFEAWENPSMAAPKKAVIDLAELAGGNLGSLAPRMLTRSEFNSARALQQVNSIPIVWLLGQPCGTNGCFIWNEVYGAVVSLLL